MIIIDAKIADQLTRHCRDCLPEEACGALIGHVNPFDKEEIFITRVVPITNRSHRPTSSFSFDANEWVSVVMGASSPAEWSELIGTFHSHPTTSARPSGPDLESEWRHLPVQLIIAMQTEDWFAFRLTKNHSSAQGGEWFNGLNIRINHPT